MKTSVSHAAEVFYAHELRNVLCVRVPDLYVANERTGEFYNFIAMKTIRLHGTSGYSIDQIEMGVKNGGRFVIYGYCISIIAITFRLTSHPYYIESGQRKSKFRLKYNLITSIFGCWAIPKGIGYSILMLRVNAEKRVVEVTAEIMERIAVQMKDADRKKIQEADLTVTYGGQELTGNIAQHNHIMPT